MSIKKLLIIGVVTNAILLGVTLAIFMINNGRIWAKTEEMINIDQTLLLNITDLYAHGLQAGQATRNILLNPNDEKARENYKDAHEGFVKASDECIKLSSEKMQDRFKKIKALWDENHNLKTEVQSLIMSGRRNEAIALLTHKETPKWREIRSAILDLMKQQRSGFKEKLGDYRLDMRKSTITLIGVIAVSLIGSFGLLFVITRKITSPLSDLTEKVEKIAGGDLRVSIEHKGKNEIGVLSGSMNRMVQSFNSMINGVFASANKVVFTVDSLREKAEKATERSQNLSNQAHQIATAAEEMSQTITDIAKNASVAQDSSREAMETAAKGKEVADNSVRTMEIVYTSTIELSTMVEKLNNRVTEIGDIVTVIKDIADQTNLLALNAAIEAARAGEQGRGFAVVADEVRKLAERTIKATAEISEKISSVQTESKQTTESMKGASEEVTKAVKYIKGVEDSLNLIFESVQKVRDQITQIATAVDEQSAASEEVAKNIEKTSAVAKEMEKMSDDVMHEVNNLTLIEEELRNSTSNFKTTNNELAILELAKTDHKIFVGKIAAHLKGDCMIDPSELPNHHSCRFGKWYDSEGKEKCGHLPSYKAIDTPHEKIHALAKEAIKACISGDKEKAHILYKEARDLSDRIMTFLDRIKSECMHASV